jgi:hypothetical protein
VAEAETRQSREGTTLARAAAAWILPALADIYGKTMDVQEISLQLTADRFVAARALLEEM